MPRTLPPDIDPAGGGGGGAPINPKSRMSWILKGTMTREQLEAVDGVGVNTLAGGYASCRFPFESLPDVEAISQVTNIRLAPPIDYAMDEAAQLIYAPPLWGGRVPPRTGLTGKGVIVAIVDTGLDLFHADFRQMQGPNQDQPNGPTRVLDAWDMTLSGTPPVGFSYGDRIDNSDIANMLNGGSQTALVDSSGHGTMVAGIAAGNGAAPNGNVPLPTGEAPFRYVGIAPEAELAIVKLPDQPTIANVVDAVTWAFKLATDTGRAVVVNLSLCSREGPHDGFSDLDKILAALIAAEDAAGRWGRGIVAAAGNDGNTYRHTVTSHPSLHSNLISQWNCFTASHSPAGIEESYWLQGWYGGDHTYRVQVSSAAGSATALAEPGTEVTQTAGGVTITVRNGMDTVNGKKKVDIRVSSSTVALSSITLFIAHPTGTGTGTIDWYMVKSLVPGKVDTATFDNVIPLPEAWKVSTITSPGSCAAALCVGAESASSTFPDSSGVIETPGTGIVGAYQPFSSQGPLLGSATVKPDLVAPATAFVTSLSGMRSPAVPYYQVDRDLKHAQVVQGTTLRDGGTSISAAFATGAGALVIQRSGKQPSAQWLAAMKLLVTSRIAPNDTAAQDALPNNKLGAGKLWLQSMVGNVGVDPSPVIPAPGGTGGGSPGDIVADPPIKRAGSPSDYPPKWMDPNTGELHNIVTGDPRLSSYVFDLPGGSSYHERETLSLRVTDANGAQVYAAAGSVAARSSVLAWNGRKQDGTALDPGVYYATVVAGENGVTRVVFL